MIGKRTITGLAGAAIPARVTIVLAILAIAASFGLHVVASTAAMIDTRVGAKLHQFAATIEAMPLWVLIGGVMAQISARINQSWDDARAWWRRERMARQIRREWFSREDDLTSGPFARRLDIYAEADLRMRGTR